MTSAQAVLAEIGHDRIACSWSSNHVTKNLIVKGPTGPEWHPFDHEQWGVVFVQEMHGVAFVSLSIKCFVRVGLLIKRVHLASSCENLEQIALLVA